MVDQVLKLPEGTAAPAARAGGDRAQGRAPRALEELRGQGFVRARIDGKVVELDDPPKLDLKRKHTIEVVVDRFKVRADLAQRLAESFETALNVGDGVARIAWMDEPAREELVFSDRMACSICGYSLSELEPRLFSFNNPVGACPTCDGLGVKQFFDPQRVVVHPHLSLAGGAVRGWDRRNAYYFQLIQALARHYDFDIETPWVELTRRCGTCSCTAVATSRSSSAISIGQGGTIRRRHRFEGIIPNLERRYRETESITVREELAKYLSNRPCPECEGTRLNRAARHVFVNGMQSSAGDAPFGRRGAGVLLRAHSRGLARRNGRARSSRRSPTGCDSWPMSGSTT